MASQKSKNSTGSIKSSNRLKKKKSDDTKLNTRPDNEIKPEMKFRKVKKISKSIKRIESEMSHIQIQMQKIGNDLATVLQLIETKKKI
ncbi:MAG: hypothetical protein WCF21_07050 [Nitrososphaeraceae archaeon]